jgi:catechol 2,3-dioxygenase-like lactoylglutathione lyase family enzyme
LKNRRRRYPAFFLVFIVAAGCSANPSAVGSPSAAPARASLGVRAVGCIGMTVSSVELSVPFYRDVLSFRKTSDTVFDRTSDMSPSVPVRRVRLDLGTECIEVDEPLGGVRRPIPADSRSNDRWFQHVAIVVRDMDRAYEWLESHRVTHVSAAPQRLPIWNRNAANIRAYYFKDPDGHALELIWFPEDKGQARWHSPEGDALFLGIDHTAIAVADTSSSLAFYVHYLGLRVAGESENWGPEQERLNDVPGAHLRITALRAAAGPGVELLEYLTPRDGRPYPPDERADDLTHWRTTMFASVAALPSGIRDPDGHTVELHPR